MTDPTVAPKHVVSQPIEIPWGAIDYDYERFTQHVCDHILDEDSALWRHMTELVEELSPGIKPYDRREFIHEALSPVRRLIADAFM